MTFGNEVGLRFKDIMSGPFGLGETEPKAGKAKGEQAGTKLSFSLDLWIPSLAEFLRADRKGVAITGGTVSWTGHAQNVPVLGDGQMVMFRKVGPKNAVFDFDFSFVDQAGEKVRFQGQKLLTDDFGLDAFGDLSTVYGTLSRGGAIVAAGVTTVHLNELFDQLFSMHVVGAKDRAEEAAALDAFWRFYNTEIHALYPEIPLLLPATDRLHPNEWRTLALIAEIMLPRSRPTNGPSVHDVVEGLQRFLISADSKTLSAIRDLLGVFGGLIADAVGPQKESVRKLVEGVLLHGEKPHLQDALLTLHGIATLPYYAHEKADALTGHWRAHIPRRIDEGFDVVMPDEVPELARRIWDVVIIGSGPAGALLAERLSAKGKSGLVLEAGPYVKEGIVDHDELTWTARLYKQAGLQRANESKNGTRPMTVLQGACVGGGAMVNNAVCFQMTSKRIQHWKSFGFPLDEAAMRAAYARVASELDIVNVSDAARSLNPTYHALKNAFGTPSPSSTAEPPMAGFHDCLVNMERKTGANDGCHGLGICNLACGAARKKNALQVYLKRALSRPNWHLVPDAEVESVRIHPWSTPHFAESVRVRLANGKTVEIRAQQFILAAGPVGSSAVLLRSNLDTAARKNVGKRFAANIGVPLFAFYDQVLRKPTADGAGPGVQIAHYYSPPGPHEAGFVIETWFNPPGAQALVLPGAFEEHFALMRRYASCGLAAPLIGTDAGGTVRLVGDKVAIDLPLGAVELDRIKRGLSTLGRAFFQGGALPDGTPLMPDQVVGGFRGRVFSMRSAADVDAYVNGLISINDLFLGTGHPQGGNAMSTQDAVGVIGADFTVRGVRNLRVCDGSVFPASAAVNPQWTIMALADLCAASMS